MTLPIGKRARARARDVLRALGVDPVVDHHGVNALGRWNEDAQRLELHLSQPVTTPDAVQDALHELDERMKRRT